jgi:Protein of unknown function (DUF2752)
VSTAATPVAAPPRPALIRPAAAVGGFLSAWGAVLLRDPHKPGRWPTCPVAAMGFACPGCGSMRGMYDLGHGHVVAAAGHNLLLLPALALLVWSWLAYTSQSMGRPMESPLQRRGAPMVTLVVAVTFGVVRNLPFAHALLP